MNIKFFATLGYDFYSSTEGTETEYVPVPVCQPEMDPDEFGTVAVTVESSPEAPNINDTKLIVGSPNMTVTSE